MKSSDAAHGMLSAHTPKDNLKQITIWLWLAVCWLPCNAHALELLLPQVYAEYIDVANRLASEKLDGVRGYWDGKRLLSKNGVVSHPPAAFIRRFPPFELEGEI